MQFKPSALLAIAGSLLASSSLVAGQLVINTPAHVRQCIPTEVTWSGAPGLFFLVVLKDGEPIQEFGGLPADQYSFTWGTNVRAGTNVTLQLNNAAGEFASTAPFVIKHGPHNCTLVN
ncbi:hypothetical protein FKP32DRAFT_1624975 [Trametes sanguinea]|nr:hypothetical protein FKP32DRAFT_1624975 [Trametes sanguinea]